MRLDWVRRRLEAWAAWVEESKRGRVASPKIDGMPHAATADVPVPDGHEEEGWTTDHISLKRIVDCPHCGSPNRIDLSDDCSESSYERQMGEEILYEFDIEDCECSSCGKLFRVSGHISEYPVGAFDSEEIKISPQ